LANGSIVKVPSDCLPDINISEEVNKSGVWKSLEANSNSSGSIKGAHEESSKLIQKRKKSRQMSVVDEDADESEDTGITIKLLKNKGGESTSSGTVTVKKEESGTGEEKAKLVSNNSTESDV
jgi:hypothetical protein